MLRIISMIFVVLICTAVSFAATPVPKLENVKTYNVLDYGAIGDGTTDDTTPCQAAINDAVAAGGGAVYFPLKHRVNYLNVNGSNLTIFGDGFNSQILFNDSQGDGLRVGSSTPTSSYTQSVMIRDLQLRAYGSNHTGAAIKLDAVWYPVISNVEIFDTFGGIFLGGTHSPQISNINIWSGKNFNSNNDTYYIKLAQTNAYNVNRPVAAYFSNIQGRYSNDSLIPGRDIKHGIWIQSADMAMFNNIHINCMLSDGVFFDGSNSSANILDVFFNNVYLDGNNAPNSNYVAARMTGSAPIWNAHFNNITARGSSSDNYAFYIDNQNVYGVFISNGELMGYTNDAIRIKAGSNFNIDKLNIYDNNIAGGYGGIYIEDNVGNFSLSNLNIGTYSSGKTQSYGIRVGANCFNYSLNGNVYGQYNDSPLIDNSKADHGPFGDINLMWDRSKLNAVNGQSLQLHASATNVDSGAYFGSMLPAQAVIAGGANFQGSQWVAKSSDATVMSFGANGVNFYTDNYLTFGNGFNPSRRMNVSNIGSTIYKTTGTITPQAGGVLLSGYTISGATGLVVTTDDNKSLKLGSNGITFPDATTQSTAVFQETQASILSKLVGSTTVVKNLKLSPTGGKFSVTEGTDACAGKATLSAGKVTVPTKCVTANSRVILTLQSCSSCGTQYLKSISSGVNFQIWSTNSADASSVYWMIVEPS